MSKLHPRAGLAAGVLALGLLAVPPALAAGPTVTVRVEGAGGTLLAPTTVTLPGTPVPGDAECGPRSAGAALEQATKGRWDRGPLVKRILGETHDYSAGDYWAEWVDRGQGYKFGAGVCTDQLRSGDTLLMLVDQAPYGEGSLAEVPLTLKGVPARVAPGQSVTVRVIGAVATSYDPGAGINRPIAGATVRGGGQRAVTNARGRATLRFTKAGRVTLRATKAGDVAAAPKALRVGAPDRIAPRGRIRGIRDGATYAPADAPRRLQGTVGRDPSGVTSLALQLSRRANGHCSAYDRADRRFERRPCGTALPFELPPARSWSYRLPERLAPGRYVLRVIATDGAGNRDRAERGRSRVVFTVA